MAGSEVPRCRPSPLGGSPLTSAPPYTPSRLLGSVDCWVCFKLFADYSSYIFKAITVGLQSNATGLHPNCSDLVLPYRRWFATNKSRGQYLAVHCVYASYVGDLFNYFIDD
ncbi:hypothetical protein ACP70R_041302 [Stipagrostis hirtigluma subsp. patula]